MNIYFIFVYSSMDISVDGGWSDWSIWGNCSVVCGNGTQARMRTCTSPVPQFGGAICQGGSDESRTCAKAHCPGNKTKDATHICHCLHLCESKLYIYVVCLLTSQVHTFHTVQYVLSLNIFYM